MFKASPPFETPGVRGLKCGCPNGHAAPSPPLSELPPSSAVPPSEESATDQPSCPGPTSPFPTSLFPCCVQRPLAPRRNTHAPPVRSSGPPIKAVVPSPESATERPISGDTLFAPISLPPCCTQTPLLRVNSHAAP